MVRVYGEPAIPTDAPAWKITFVYRTPARLCSEVHWYGGPLSSLETILPLAVDLASIRAALLPGDCLLMEVRVGQEGIYLDPLTLSQGVYWDGQAAWGTVHTGLDCLNVQFRGISRRSKNTFVGGIPDACISNDRFQRDALFDWTKLLYAYLKGLCGETQWPKGTWGWLGVEEDDQGAPHVDVWGVTGVMGDQSATVTTLQPHGVPANGVCRISGSPWATAEYPLNRIWSAVGIDATTLIILDFPLISADFSLLAGGKLWNLQRTFHAYDTWHVTRPGTRERRGTGGPCSWEIIEAPWNALINPGCYAMACLEDKHCYRSKARIFADNNTEVTLRWFRVPDGQPFLPIPHLWGGRPWRYDRTPPTNGPGELTQDHITYAPDVPPAVCWQWLGSDDWWSQGIPYADVGGGPLVQVRPGLCQDVYEPVYTGTLPLALTMSYAFAGIITPCNPDSALPVNLWASFEYIGPPFGFGGVLQWYDQAIKLTWTASLAYDGDTGPGWYASGSFHTPYEGHTLIYEIYFFCSAQWTGGWPGGWQEVVLWNWSDDPFPVWQGGILNLGGLRNWGDFVYQGQEYQYYLEPGAEGLYYNVGVGINPAHQGSLPLKLRLYPTVYKTGTLPLVITLHGKLTVKEKGTLPLILDLAGVAAPILPGTLPLSLTLTGSLAVLHTCTLPLSIALAGTLPTPPAKVGTLPVVLTVTGKATPIVSKAGTLPVVLTVTGKATPIVSKAGTLPVALAVTGKATPIVSKAGTLPVVLTVTGKATPIVSKAGTLPVVLTVTGKATPIVSKAGTLPVVLTVTGKATPIVSKAGTLPVVLTVTGKATPIVSKAGTLPVVLTVTGKATPIVSKAGTLPVALAVTGKPAIAFKGTLNCVLTTAGVKVAVNPGHAALILALQSKVFGTYAKIVIVSATGNFTVPSDWNNSQNIIIGLGGSGASGVGGTATPLATGGGGGGGGGGACAWLQNVPLTPGANIPVTIGAGGATASASGGNTTLDTILIVAVGGGGGVAGTTAGGGGGGVGGQTSACTPSTTAFAGGNGGAGGAATLSANGGGGGGGAAGLFAAGQAGTAGALNGGNGGQGDPTWGGTGAVGGTGVGAVGGTGTETDTSLDSGGGGSGGGATTLINSLGAAGGAGGPNGGGAGGGGGAGTHTGGTGSTAGGAFAAGYKGRLVCLYNP